MDDYVFDKSIFYYGFTILAYGHHEYILEIKESLLIKRDRPVRNKNVSSVNCFFLAITRTLNVFIIP